MAHLMMMHQPMPSYNQPMHQSINQSINQANNHQYMYNPPPFNSMMMSPLQQPINQSISQSINQSMSHPMMLMPPSSHMNMPPQSYQTINRPPTSTISPSLHPSINQSINAPSSNDVRVSFSSMLVHPNHPNVIYYQLRADGHNQDLIIEHPTGWSIVNPEADFVEHLVAQAGQSRISRDKWPIPLAMQLAFKSCDTSRLMPERTVTRFTVSRYSQMEWKEAMKAVKSLKDEEVVRAKMRVTFGLYRNQLTPSTQQAPIVAYESTILLGWRTTRSSAKRRIASNKQSINQSNQSIGVNASLSSSSSNSHPSTHSINQTNEALLANVPELVLDSSLSTPASNGSMNLMNNTERVTNKRARDVHQQISDALNAHESVNQDERDQKRAKMFTDVSERLPVKRPSPIRRPVNGSTNQTNERSNEQLNHPLNNVQDNVMPVSDSFHTTHPTD